jgi:hypothetical protein
MKKQQHRRRRSNDGYSVLFVITMGVIALMGVMAVMDALVSAQRNVASQVYMNEASSAAENALQYALGVINLAASNGSLSSVTSPIPIPSSITGNATVVVNMTSIPPLLLNDPKNPTPLFSQQTNPIAQSLDYRLLSAQAQYGTYRRTINVVLGPDIFPTNPPGKTPPPPPATNYFNQGLLSNQGMQINGVNVQFDPTYAVSSASYGQIVASSNGPIQLSGSVAIDGSLNAPSYTVPPLVTDGSGNPTSSIRVNGNVSYTGSGPNPYTTDFITDPGGTNPTPGANILGDGRAGGAQNLPGTITNTAAVTQQAPAQIQTAMSPAGLTVNGSSPGNQSITVQNPISVQNPSGIVTSLGAINLTGTDSLTLSPGQYVVNSISTSPGSVININMPSSGTPAPVQIYVQGDSPNASALLIQGNVKMTGSTSASNLQIFYNGSEAIQVNPLGSTNFNFMGQIYAPNSSVSINTTGGVVNGSIVANNLSLSGTGNYYYDPRTVSSTGAGLPKGAAAGPGYTIIPGSPPSQFYVLSWQEQTTGAQ